MDYGLCDQTVTVYRSQGDTVSRTVIPNAYFSMEQGFAQKQQEREERREFLLIIPGPKVQVYVGDRVLPGVGPAQVDWERFTPALVENLVEVGRTRHYRYGGEICHVEAQAPWN